jgi:hypothetical protein
MQNPTLGCAHCHGAFRCSGSIIVATTRRQACGRDYQANCAGVRPGGGQLVACLAANQARLSPGCQRALAMAKPGL